LWHAGIALSSLIFSRNSSFQLGMCLLIMLLAFGGEWYGHYLD